MLLKCPVKQKGCPGPAKSTNGQHLNIEAEQKKDNRKPCYRVVGQIHAVSVKILSSFKVSFRDGDESHSSMGGADDCANEWIVSARTAERAVLNVVGKMPKISPFEL